MTKIEIRIDEETKAAYQKAAKRSGTTLSDWIKSMVSIGSGIYARRGKKLVKLAESGEKP
jgi:Protein of unknown function (DUF1778)